MIDNKLRFYRFKEDDLLRVAELKEHDDFLKYFQAAFHHAAVSNLVFFHRH